MQYLSYACSIQLEETVVITGGYNTTRRVSVYSFDGWVEDLPDLLTGRSDHGCGHYINNDDKMVAIFLLQLIFNFCVSGIFGDWGIHWL